MFARRSEMFAEIVDDGRDAPPSRLREKGLLG